MIPRFGFKEYCAYIMKHSRLQRAPILAAKSPRFGLQGAPGFMKTAQSSQFQTAKSAQFWLQIAPKFDYKEPPVLCRLHAQRSQFQTAKSPQFWLQKAPVFDYKEPLFF